MRIKRPTATAAVTLISIGVLVSACSSGSSTPAAAGSSAAPAAAALTINVFGDSFPPAMYRAYEAAHPGITIKENRADYGTHHTNLQAHLTAGAGLADLEVIEVGQIPGFIGQSDKFTNFLDQGVDTSTWTKAKVQQASTPDGKTLIGLPTDTGGLAVCYRQDLFAKAGLPTDPAAVGALWPTWKDYVATGQKYLSKAPKGSKWIDAGGTLFNGITGNEATTYYDASGAVIAATNPAVKAGWDLTVQAIKAGESASLAGFSPEWNAGFKQGQFATITCPAWMLGYIRSNAPETAGKWNIAKVPGGSGNWGGSFVSVPKAGKHIAQAVELAKWLTSPAQDIEIFKTLGNFPSAVPAWTDPAVSGATDKFFGNAPTGKIFPESLKDATPTIYGAQWGTINTAMGAALTSVEKGTNPDTAWSKFLKDVAAAAA